MKQLIGLIRLGALTALSVALCGGHGRTEGTETTQNHHFKRPDWQPRPPGALVLRDIDGTVFAREVDLTPHAS
jgi:hypothetical protein